MENKKVP